MDITNRLRKLVATLDDIKVRRQEGLFVAEGTKCVLDTLPYFECEYLFVTTQWIENHKSITTKCEPTVVKRADLERMSQLSTPTQVIAVYKIPAFEIDETAISQGLTIALDRVQDPGNLGTIMRIADWFGIRQIIASHDTVDVYNPKVVQSTMGAISRVKVHYVDLPEWLDSHSSLPIYGTFLNGNNIYSSHLTSHGIIVMGNEGKGISDAVASKVNQRLLIPSYPPESNTSESLNVGMATAITIAEFRRRLNL